MAVSQAVLELLVKMKDEASSGLSSLGGTLSSLGGIAGGVALAGVAAFTGALVSGIGDAKQTAQLMAQTEAVIKSTGGAAGVSAQQVADYASSLSDAAGASLFGDDQIQESENLLLTFTNIKDKSLQAATAISVDMAQALGGAPKDAAIQLGKALNDPIQGISALSRVGVTFTDQQKAQIKAMQESGNMAGAQKVILDELNKEFGGSAKAAADATGGWSEFTGRLGEAKEALGTAVLPLLNLVAGALNDNVLPVVEAGAAAFGDLVKAFQVGAEEGGGFIGGITNALYSLDAISPVFDTVADGIIRVMSIWEDAGAVTSSFAERVGYLLDTFMGVGDETIGPLQAFGASLAAVFSDGGIQGGMQFLIDKLAEISPGFALLKAVVEAALPPIQDIVLSVFGIITGFIQEHGATILADVTAVWTQIQALIAAVVPPIQAIVGAVFGAIATFLHAHGDDIKAFLAATWDQIAAIVKVAVALIQAIVVPVFTFIAGFLKDHGEQIQAVLSDAWTIIKTVITTALAIIKGVLTAALQAINGDWSGAWETIKSTVSTVWDGIKTVISAGWDAIKTMFGGFAADAVAFGAGIINSIVSGVQDAAGQLADIVSNAVGDALAAGKRALHDAGVPGFAGGVTNFSGGLALVGERGPELVALPRGSNVYPAGQTRQMLAGGGGGGGDTYVYNIDARGSQMTERQFEAAVRRVMDDSGDKALKRGRTGG